jgi:hypothetical protein
MSFAALPNDLIALVAGLDSAMNAAMPWWLALGFWGLIAGGLSTIVYWLITPEKRLAELRHDASSVRQALRTLVTQDAGFSPTMRLAWRSIQLSLKEVGLVSAPTAAAYAPGLLLVSYLMRAPRYAKSAVGTPPGFDLAGGVFLIAATASALALRKILAKR